MKVGIVTIHDMANVGNRLQNFALYRALEDLGHEPFVIPNEPYHYSREGTETVAPREAEPVAPGEEAVAPGEEAVESPARQGHRSVVLKAARRGTDLGAKVLKAVSDGELRTVPARATKERRRSPLTDFTLSRMRLESTHVRGPGDAAPLKDRYGSFIVGSDQVWNPAYRGGCPTDFLRFAHPHQRISYAASLGTAQLSDEYRAHYARMLEGFEHISVRESEGSRLISEITGREVPVVLDPTLLLSVEEWSRIADQAPALTSPTLGTYLLVSSGGSTRSGVRAVARAKKLKVADLISPFALSSRWYGIANFLRVIRDSEQVITDSFHATLFAIMFETPVRVLRRGPGQDARLETLLHTFGADADTAFGAASDPVDQPLVREPEAISQAARESSLSWLGGALEAAGAHS